MRGTFLYPAAKVGPRHHCRLPLSTTGDERRCERLSPTTLDGCHWAATSFRPPSRRPTPLLGTPVPALQTSSRPFNIEKHKLLTSVVLKQQRGFRPPLYPGCLKWHLPVCSSSALHLGLANLPGWFVRVMGRSSAVLQALGLGVRGAGFEVGLGWKLIKSCIGFNLESVCLSASFQGGSVLSLNFPSLCIRVWFLPLSYCLYVKRG